MPLPPDRRPADVEGRDESEGQASEDTDHDARRAAAIGPAAAPATSTTAAARASAPGRSCAARPRSGVGGRRRVRVSAIRPEVAASRRENTRERVAVGDGDELALEVEVRSVVSTEDERLGRGSRVCRAAVRPAGADKGRVPDQLVALDGEVHRGGDGHRIAQCAREEVVHDGAVRADVAPVLVTEPCARSHGDANSESQQGKNAVRNIATAGRLLDDDVFLAGTLSLRRRVVVRGEAAKNRVVPHDGVGVIALPRKVVDHVDTTQKRMLQGQVSNVSLDKDMETDVDDPDCIILNKSTRSPEQNDTCRDST